MRENLNLMCHIDPRRIVAETRYVYHDAPHRMRYRKLVYSFRLMTKEDGVRSYYVNKSDVMWCSVAWRGTCGVNLKYQCIGVI